MPFEKTNTVGVIGSGAMGSGIAQVAAQAGENVILFDSNAAALEKAKSNLDATLKKLVEKGKISVDEAKNILGRINFVNSTGDFKSCNLIIEAIVENLEVKQKVF